MNRFRTSVALAGLSLLLAGCGEESVAGRDPVYPVSGEVLYHGQPVVGADVTFTCAEKNRSAFAKTDSEGKFKLTTYAPNDGAVEGKHVIVVTKIEAAAPTKAVVPISDPGYQPPGFNESTDPEPPKNTIPAKYGDAKTTDLFAVVTDGDNPEMTLELKD